MLKELAAGEVFDEVAVGGEEVVVGEIFEAGPNHLGEDAVLEVAGEVADGEELEVDGAAVAVVVAEMGDAGADGGFDGQFLAQLAGQGLLGGLAGFDLAAGEFPLQGHGLIGAALADKDLAAADDERCNDKAERGPGRLGAGQLLASFHTVSVQGLQALQNVGVWVGLRWSPDAGCAGRGDPLDSRPGGWRYGGDALLAVDGGVDPFGGGGAEVGPAVAGGGFEQGR